MHTGLIQPELLTDGQVCVDMGEPILEGPRIPTLLYPTADADRVIRAQLPVCDKTWLVTTVSMGNPHAVVYATTEGDIKVLTLP